MPEAARLARSRLRRGTVVVADEQTAGQGRHGRHWHSEPDSGLYVSIVLRPALPADSLPVLTLALGLATAEAIARATGLACDLRWPNDVMLDERKVAGILVQLLDSAAIAGIGINVNHAAFPAGNRARRPHRFESFRTAPHSREQLLIALLPAVDRYCGMLAAEGGRKRFSNMFSRRSSYARNKRVTRGQGASILEGTTAGLDPSGFLIVRKDDGDAGSDVCVTLRGGVRPGLNLCCWHSTRAIPT